MFRIPSHYIRLKMRGFSLFTSLVTILFVDLVFGNFYFIKTFRSLNLYNVKTSHLQAIKR